MCVHLAKASNKTDIEKTQQFSKIKTVQAQKTANQNISQ